LSGIGTEFINAFETGMQELKTSLIKQYMMKMYGETKYSSTVS
jgi:hypothetical protein